jgi:hypothetical protein
LFQALEPTECIPENSQAVPLLSLLPLNDEKQGQKTLLWFAFVL